MIEVDPRIQERFDRNLAGYRERSAQIGDELAARQRQIAEQAKQADAKAVAERTQLLADVREKFDKDKMEGRHRPASTWTTGRPAGQRDGVMAFGGAGDEEAPVPPNPTPPVLPEPTPPVQPAPGRRPAHKARDVFEEDNSEESWLR